MFSIKWVLTASYNSKINNVVWWVQKKVNMHGAVWTSLHCMAYCTEYANVLRPLFPFEGTQVLRSKWLLFYAAQSVQNSWVQSNRLRLWVGESVMPSAHWAEVRFLVPALPRWRAISSDMKVFKSTSCSPFLLRPAFELLLTWVGEPGVLERTLMPAIAPLRPGTKEEFIHVHYFTL